MTGLPEAIGLVMSGGPIPYSSWLPFLNAAGLIGRNRYPCAASSAWLAALVLFLPMCVEVINRGIVRTGLFAFVRRIAATDGRFAALRRKPLYS
jgi:hypothetical protein